MRHVIGIDAGGTKTVGLLADESGAIQAKTIGDGANLLVHGELVSRFKALQSSDGDDSALALLDSPIPRSMPNG